MTNTVTAEDNAHTERIIRENLAEAKKYRPEVNYANGWRLDVEFLLMRLDEARAANV